MKDKSPALQWYPKQALGDDKILAMDWDAKGMHYTLLWISWQQEPPGTLPNDMAAIRRWIGSPSEETWRRVSSQVLAAWPLQSDRRVNAGMVRAWERQQTYKQNGSKKGAKPKQVAEEEDEEVLAKELPKISLAQKVAGEMCLQGPGVIQEIAGAIEFLVKHDRKSPNAAVEFLIAQGKDEIDRGGAPDRFWFASRKWRATTVQPRMTREDLARKQAFEEAERKDRAKGAGV